MQIPDNPLAGRRDSPLPCIGMQHACRDCRLSSWDPVRQQLSRGSTGLLLCSIPLGDVMRASRAAAKVSNVCGGHMTACRSKVCVFQGSAVS